MIHVVSESLYQRFGRFVAVISGSGCLSFIGSPEEEKFSVFRHAQAVSNQQSAVSQSAIRNPQFFIVPTSTCRAAPRSSCG
jgi:hypothetical protein